MTMERARVWSERVPDVRGDVTLQARRSAAAGKCAHCGGLVRLAWNEDCHETSLVHAAPRCVEWQEGGVVYFARARSVDAARVVDLVDDQQAQCWTRCEDEVRP